MKVYSGDFLLESTILQGGGLKGIAKGLFSRFCGRDSGRSPSPGFEYAPLPLKQQQPSRHMHSVVGPSGFW